MNDSLSAWGHLEKLVWRDVLIVVAVLLLARLLILAMQWQLRHAAEKARPHRRLAILRIVPIARLLIRAAAILVIVPLLVEPTLRNILALSAGLGLALAYTLKDYGSSFMAGLVTVLEKTYQPGDWIEVDGAYGEVKSIDGRAVRLVTADDTEVIIPHSRLWSTSIFNASSGNRSLLCIVPAPCGTRRARQRTDPAVRTAASGHRPKPKLERQTRLLHLCEVRYSAIGPVEASCRGGGRDHIGKC